MTQPKIARKSDYAAICHELGFCPESHFVAVTTRGTISYSLGKPDEIRALYAACVRCGYRPSRGLVEVIDAMGY